MNTATVAGIKKKKDNEISNSSKLASFQKSR